MVRTRFMITSLAVHLTRIAVGDCHDGVLFYYYQEDTHQLEQLYCDPVHRLVADCVLMDTDTAVASDRHGNFCVLSCTNIPEESVSPERNLTLSCSYHVGEAIMRICKASLAYDSTMDDNQKAHSGRKSGQHCPNSSVVATSLLGSVFIFIQLSRYLVLVFHLLVGLQQHVTLNRKPQTA
jgi:splicing factor 3B subunit 3